MIKSCRNVILLLACLALFVGPEISSAQDQDKGSDSKSDKAKYNCDDLDKLDINTSKRAYPEAVTYCVSNGWEPPNSWKINKGENRGSRAGGSGGVDNSTTTAPEVTGNSRNANASVSRERIRFVCNFPPKVKVNASTDGLKVTSNDACYNYFAGLIRDKDGNSTSITTPNTTDGDSCPPLTDTTGLYGLDKKFIPGPNAYACGSMAPTTTYDIALTPNPNYLAVTEEGSYYIWIYKREGTSFKLIVNAAPLPTYLCGKETEAGSTKSVDLTPPIAQMITFNATDTVSLRLQSRATMDLNFIPPYDENQPESYLLIRFDESGKLDLPINCSLDEKYFLPQPPLQDIYINSLTIPRCEVPKLTSTAQNDPKTSCPSGSNYNDTTKKCVDGTGKATDPIITDNWQMTCPNNAKAVTTPCPTGSTAKACYTCPQSKGIPNTNGGVAVPDQSGLTYCSDGSPAVGGTCPPSTGTPTSVSCKGNDPRTSQNCSTSEKPLTSGACKNKVQFGVLDSPNLYFPPGTTATTYPIEGRGSSMIATVPNSELYTQSETSVFLQATAPDMIFSEGGTLTLPNGDQLMLSAMSVVSPKKLLVTFTNGGQLVGPAGVRKKVFNDEETYNLPPITPDKPVEVHTGLTIQMPGGYMVPSAPENQVRLPVDRPQ